jgi:hypothetical protein
VEELSARRTGPTALATAMRRGCRQPPSSTRVEGTRGRGRHTGYTGVRPAPTRRAGRASRRSLHSRVGGSGCKCVTGRPRRR